MATFPPATNPTPAVTARPQVARDWLKTLFPASYKGVPFFVEVDDENGSRRIVEHEFPMRDFPYNEDLGEGVRHYEITGYVASDSSDADAASVIAICATRGPGALVLPSQGPVIVRCLDFKRSRSKDKHGYEALTLKFTREGAAGALVSIASLANTVFVTAEATALASALSFARATVTAAQPSYVVDAAIDGVQNSASALEALRTSASVDPATSTAQQTEIQSIFDAAASVADQPVVGAVTFVTAAGQSANSPAVDLIARITASARALSKAMAPFDAMAQFEELFTENQGTVIPPVYITSGTLQEAVNKAAGSQALRVAALISFSEAIARASLPDRPSAITLRANVAEYFESELLVVNAANIELARAIMAMRDSVINYLSLAVISLAPVITVEANLSMPSLFWSWRLYSDPTRATELTLRNSLSHPSFFPLAFEALAN